MKKKILFVDDEPMVLQGIERMLRPMRDEWEMDFAAGGVDAMESLGTGKYHVIVTDLMMPRVDGVQLLTHVKEQFPTTIRIVLSGHAEEHLAMKCVGIAHQFLAKPCEPATLKNTISRVTNSGFGIHSDAIATLVTKLHDLPSTPLVYTKMAALLNHPNTTLDDIGDVISSDMALTAKVLQTVNSSFFGIARRISKPSEAAGFLGIDTLKTLVLTMNLFGRFETKVAPGFSVRAASEHSGQVGAAARAIALAEGSSRTIVEDSLAAGLLHDIGKLVLASAMSEEFDRFASHGIVGSVEAERLAFGATHADVGAYLLGLWGLPAAVVEAVGLHHSPQESQAEQFTALTATHVANHLVGELAAQTQGRQHASPDVDYLNRLGLSDRITNWRSVVAESLRAP